MIALSRGDVQPADSAGDCRPFLTQDFYIEDNITPVFREGQQPFCKLFDYLD